MYILDSGCGWIPDAPIKFMYHIINLIKNLTPVVLIIMGSLDFGKAVMSQKEDEIKKAQGAFIKKLIAGAAVFFVVVFARWVLTIIDNTGQVDTSNAFRCVSLLLKGSYSADDKTYYDGPNTTSTTTTTTTTNNKPINIIDSCKNKCDQQESIGGLVGTAASIISKNECKKACETDNQNIINAINACKNNCPEKEYHWTNSGNMNIPTISNASEIKACEQKCETTDYNNYLSSTHESSTGQTHGGGGGNF